MLLELAHALARGPDSELEALKKCTGCAACGHDSGTRSSCKCHPDKRGCPACGTTRGCIERPGCK